MQNLADFTLIFNTLVLSPAHRSVIQTELLNLLGSPSFNSATHAKVFNDIDNMLGVFGTGSLIRQKAKKLTTHNLLDTSKCKCPLLAGMFPSARERGTLGVNEPVTPRPYPEQHDASATPRSPSLPEEATAEGGAHPPASRRTNRGDPASQRASQSREKEEQDAVVDAETLAEMNWWDATDLDTVDVMALLRAPSLSAFHASHMTAQAERNRLTEENRRLRRVLRQPAAFQHSPASSVSTEHAIRTTVFYSAEGDESEEEQEEEEEEDYLDRSIPHDTYM